MHLTSHDQASVDLRIRGYQFPGSGAQGEHDWDANWLQVGGTVVQADGHTWSFDDPCLTTWEAEELGTWLSDAATGAVPPPPLGTDEPELLVFTEPNLAFGLDGRIADRVRVRVYFSLEALPPWLQGEDRFNLFEYFVLLELSAAELAQAADDWALDLTRFPKR